MWHTNNIKDIYEKLDSSILGLSEEESNNRLIKYGYNELPKKKSDNIFQIFLSELINPIVLLLMFIVIMSFLLGEYIDAVVIMFIILIDLILGTYQEYKAEKTAEALKNLISIKTNVIRNGREIVIESKNIVVGDIIVLDSGDKITADARIIECNNLIVDESILTGESIGIEKNNNELKEKVLLTDRTNMLYAGTSVLMGRCKAIVIGTASDTEIGKIANDVNNVKKEKSPLTIRIEKFSKQICFITLTVAIFIALVLFIKGYDIITIFESVIALSVSAMPEGLPLALTMALTVSSMRMQKKNVIVKKLNSVESLGSCTVIASDKTGTLTANEQTAKIIYNKDLIFVDGSGYNSIGNINYKNNEESINEIALLGYINNECVVNGDMCYGDSIDIAFHYLGEKAKVNTKGIEVISTIPYESANKYSAVFYKIDNKVYCTIKGSCEKVLSFCKNKDNYLEKNDELASMGYRVIAVANGVVKEKDNYTEEDIKDIFIKGLVGFIDPVRSDVVTSIKKCFNAGIKVLMITGDHPKTAYSIAKELGIALDYSQVIVKEDFDKYIDNEFEFDEMIKTKTVFARVTPSDKLKIVESLKRSGEFIAVTGDGVNDAPAIKSANIGISMGSGTDVAKETAAMIIKDDSFSSIVMGIEEGRVAYSNIRKVIYMLLSCGFCEILIFLLSMIFNLPMPLIAIQLLWLNVVTDGLQDFALSFEKKEDGIMEESPRSPKEALFDKILFREILLSGISMGLIVFVLWFVLMKNNINILLARGYIMALMVYLQNFQVLNCCSEKKTIFKHNYKSNILIIITVFGAMILQFIVSESHILSAFFKIKNIPIAHMILLIAYSSIILLVMEIYKLIINSRKI